MTDIVATNYTSSVAFFTVARGSATCGVIATDNYRLRDVAVPPSSTVHLPLQTGIGFGSGQEICVTGTVGNLLINFRGFLFTPS